MIPPARIDAHQHFWQRSQPFAYDWLDAPGNERIAGDFLPVNLRPHLDACGLTASVFVQTQHNIDENRWVLSLADAHRWILGVVGWVDLASEACESQLLELRRHPKFVGVRHITQDEPDDDFIVRPEILRGLKVLEKHGVPFDLLFYEKHLRHAPTVARACPTLPLVLDHLAKPQIHRGWTKADTWRREIREAAACENVACKLSGLVTEADRAAWTADDLRPFVMHAVEAFGPARCMYGSDWPVCGLAGSYEAVYGAIRDIVATLTDAEKTAVFGGTAARVYGLR